MITQIIAKYQDKPGFRSRPVENFLSSMGGMTKRDALLNLEQDKKSYGWKPSIVSAIKEGINKLAK